MMTRLALALTLFAVATVAQPRISITAPDPDVKAQPRTATCYTEYNAALLNAVLYAWETDREHAIVPSWIETARFDFVADGGGTDPRPALRAAIELKFFFSAEWQSRPTEVWVLRKARRDADSQTASADSGAPAGNPFSPGVLDGTYAIENLRHLLQFILNGMVADETESGDARYRITAHWTPGDSGGLARAMGENGFELTRETREIRFLVINGGQPPEAAAASSYPCQPDSSLAAAIAALPDVGDLSRSWEARMAPRRKLLDVSAGVFAGMAAADAIRDKPYLAADWDWALAQFRKLPDSLAAAFLEARLIGGLAPAKARALLDAALQRAPDYPWAHLEMAELARNPREADPELRQFLKACPSSLAAGAIFEKAQDPELLRAAAAALRAAIGARQDDDALVAESHVWHIHRKLGEPGPQAGQLAAIRALDRGADRVWLGVLNEGYRIAGDEASGPSLAEQIATAHPASQLAFEILHARWETGHPASGAGYASELARAVDEWAFEWPQLPQIVFERWRALAALPEAPADQLESAAAFFLQVSGLYPDLRQPVPAPLSVAQVLGARKLRTADLKAWTEQGIAQAREQERFPLEAEDSQLRRAAQQRLASLKAR